MLIDGIVSNCWQDQLAGGAGLVDLVSEAVVRGYNVIELRQGNLGSFESSDKFIPRTERLTELPEKFPEVRFNIALSVPFLAPLKSEHEELVAAGARAAAAVAGKYQSHLRLVDLKSSFEFDVLVATQNLVRLARSMDKCGVMLSVEHSVQQWGSFLEAFRLARQGLGDAQNCLQLCFDPCNLALFEPAVDLIAALRALSPGEISMVHFKQCSQNAVLPVLAPGDVDFAAVFSALNDINYSGPTLFEVAPSADIWQMLDTSQQFLAEIAGNTSR